MASTSAAALDQACSRRYPAWTLHARAFTGSRAVADDLVRRAIGTARRSDQASSSEAAAHRYVLQAIRDEGLRRARSNETAGVLGSLHADFAGAASRARAALRRLPKLERRAIELHLRKRRSISQREAASHLSVSPSVLNDAFERGLETIASALGSSGARRKRERVHPSRSSLLAYVSGALSGDEARDVTTHASACSLCGDALGVMIVLKASATESARVPRLTRSQRSSTVWVLAIVALAALAVTAQALWPNPWAAYATEEGVPSWFYDFFYGEGRADSAGGSTARGLALLVDGDLHEAIETLQPQAAGPRANPEAAAYAGIARYLSGERSRRTVRLLEHGTESIRAGRLARWYLANALLWRRDLDGAKRHLEGLARTQDWFGRRAATLLEELTKPEPGSDGIAA